MSTATKSRPIPTAAEARSHPLAGTVRTAARAVTRDGRTRYVVVTYTRYAILTEAPKFGSYWIVHADRAERVEQD